MKKHIALLSCLTILFFIYGGEVHAETKLSNRVLPVSVISTENPGEAYKMLDNDTNTAWIYTRVINPATSRFLFGNQTINAIYIRYGEYSSEKNYQHYDRPTESFIRINTADGKSMQQTFRLPDAYEPTVNREDKLEGYYIIQFDVPVQNVSSIEITMTDFVPGTGNTGKMAISDVSFTSHTTPKANSSVNIESQSTIVSQSSNPSSVKSHQEATLLKRIATRSGPSTNYDELGSFLSLGDKIVVIQKAWDHRNDRWWLQVEFNHWRGQICRAYTGLQRVDIDPITLPTEEVQKYNARVTCSTKAFWGPGANYYAHGFNVSAGTICDLIMIENGYALIEYYGGPVELRRVWIDASCVQ